MILLISDKKEIIGVDEELIDKKSFEEFTQNFSKEDLSNLIENKHDEFEYSMKNENFEITKKILISKNGEIYLFSFKKTAKPIEEESILLNDDLLLDNNNLINETEPITQSQEIKLDEEKESESPIIILDEDTNQDNSKIEENKEKNISIQEDNLLFDLENTEKNNKQEIKNNTFSDNLLDLGLDDNIESEENKNNLIQTKQNKEQDKDDGLIIDLGLLDTDEEEIVNEDENDEFSKFLNLPKNELDTFINEELNNASKELEIEISEIKAFFNDFKKQILDEKEIFYNAIEESNYDLIHESAHKLKGVAFNLRLDKIGKIFEKIDNLSKQKDKIEKISKLIDEVYIFLDKISEAKNKNTDNKICPKNDQYIICEAIIKSLIYLKAENNIEEIKNSLLKITQYITLDDIDVINSFNTKEEFINYIDKLKNKIQKEIL